MNILYILGNGFDKNFGYKSTYPEIYDAYIENSEADTEVISKFKKSIKESKYEFWHDFEMALPQFGVQLGDEDSWFECIEDFQIFTMNYLTEENKRIASTINARKSTIIRNRMKLYLMGLIPSERDKFLEDSNTNIDVITFNYTSLIDKAIGDSSSVVHIHGDLLGRQAIFGVDCEEQLNVLPFTIKERNKKKILKPVYNQSYDPRRVRIAENMIATADIIYIYGASLGESDLTWRNHVIDWLEENEQNQLIVYDMNLSFDPNLTPQKMLDLKDNKVIELCKNWNIEYTQFKDQIHFPYNFNIFDIEEIERASSSNHFNVFDTGILMPL